MPILSFFAEHYKISATCPPTPLLATCQQAAVVEEEQHQTLLSGRSPAPDIGRQNVKMYNLRLPDALDLPDTEGGHQLPGSQLRTEPPTLSLGSCRRPESSKNLFNIRYPRSNLFLDDLVCLNGYQFALLLPHFFSLAYMEENISRGGVRII